MSDLVKRSVSQIQQLRGDLLRYEAAVPNAITYLEWLWGGGNPQGAIKLDMLKSYLDTLSRFLKLVHRIDGNFPFDLFQSDETLRLMAWGYTVLYRDRLISLTQAAKMLGCSEFVLYRMLHPNKGQPKLTAYFDPAKRIRGHGSRVLIDEVNELMKGKNRE